MMFTVLGYQFEDADLTAALATVRRHIEPGGFFIFDVWNGRAVLAERPGERSVSERGPTQITRNSRSALDIPRHLCRVRFDLERVERDGRIEKWQEEHVMRYYFPQELERSLWQNGFGLLGLRGFPNDDAPADERTWNVVGTAQAQ